MLVKIVYREGLPDVSFSAKRAGVQNEHIYRAVGEGVFHHISGVNGDFSDERVLTRNMKSGWRKAILEGGDPRSVAEQYGLKIEVEIWDRFGVNFTNNEPTYNLRDSYVIDRERAQKEKALV